MAARPETHMSSSSSSSESYEVFLSFRGQDTRGNFTDHLYHALKRGGIRTFKDNEELKRGKDIGEGLMKAIIESKISIPIFSENYASSKWCLKELAEIMKCMENSGQIVFPVFYKVNPSNIRNQTGSFAEVFHEHEKTQPKGCVDSWRKALKQAGNLRGWHYEKPEDSEADLIDSIVEEVWKELKKTTALYVGNHLMGIDSRVDDVIRLLDLDSQDVQYMGICGMGGLGKTAIARAVFNKICCDFKRFSFLEVVSSTSQQVESLVKLQNKLVSDILGANLRLDNVAQGMNIIKERCHHKKVLIILDDVDHDEQLHALAYHPSWFGPGSRIIITTRDKDILKQVDETKIYMPKVLNDNQSLKLFCNHAFGKDQPPKTFMLLSRNVVKIAGGLPLAIEVMGSFLYGESCHNEWKSKVDILEKIPHDDIKKKLQISYDRLNASEKNTFLDIACFFIGMDKEIVIHILEDFFPEKNIKVLVRKSLVSIDNNNMLRMHNLLRDMGREIVRQESPENAGKRTRLWSRNKALDVLKNSKGTSSIQGLSLVFHCSCLKIEAFKSMSNLRLLQVDGAYLDGNFDALSTELKWLSLKRIPSKCIPSISHLRKLSVLDLSESMITKDWRGWQHIQKVKTLKVLDLGGCDRLTRTPAFSYNTRLQRLILDRCSSLAVCDESIGCLKKLVYLTLKCCANIKKLPDSICKLCSLTNLILSDCRRLEKLPKALGDMKSLTELMIDGTDIEELPDSIGSLEKLVSLSAEDCKNIKELPDSICKLSSLTNLILSGCRKLEKLPKALGNMKSLTELVIDRTDIEELPDSIGSLEKLVSLSAMDCWKLARLPLSMGKLRRLENINLLGSCIDELPEGLENLSSLKELRFENLSSL